MFMKIKLSSRHYRASDEGAVTIDWVVLVSAIALIGLTIVGLVRGGTKSMSNNLSGALAEMTVGATNLPGGS